MARWPPTHVRPDRGGELGGAGTGGIGESMDVIGAIERRVSCRAIGQNAFDELRGEVERTNRSPRESRN